MKMRKRLTVTMAGAAAALVVGSIAWAAIPDTNGVIHGCYDGGGHLRVIDTASKSCTAKETAIQWAERGPMGPAGPQGVQGPAGNSPQADAFLGRYGQNVGNAAAATGTECTLGEIRLTASINHTAGGVPANGQLMPINVNTALFALLGTTYGGDGKTTFALPDLRPVTPNNMTYSICVNGVWPS